VGLFKILILAGFFANFGGLFSRSLFWRAFSRSSFKQDFFRPKPSLILLVFDIYDDTAEILVIKFQARRQESPFRPVHGPGQQGRPFDSNVTAIKQSIYDCVNNLIAQHEQQPDHLENIFQVEILFACPPITNYFPWFQWAMR
jgi:hypothetical protein